MSKGDIGSRVRECLSSQRNEKVLGEILRKMGRVAAKKQMLESEHPLLAYQNRLWIGNYSFANSPQFIQSAQISTVISCIQLPSSLHLPTLQYKCFPLKDGNDDRFRSAVWALIEYVQSRPGNILLHCFSGRSRSVALLLALLIRKNKCTFTEALGELKSIYPIASPNSYFQVSLKAMEGELHASHQSIELLSHSQPQNDNLLGEQFSGGAVLSPKKTEGNEFNLLQMQSDKPAATIDLLEPIVLSPTSASKDQSSPTNNLINIFETTSATKISQKDIELLDLTHQEKPHPYNPVPQDTTEKAEEPLLTLNVPSQSESVEVKPAAKSEGESINLLGQQKAKGQEQQLVDSLKFDQKKVKAKKGRKK